MLTRFVKDIKSNKKIYSFIAMCFSFGALVGIFCVVFSKKDNPSTISPLITGLFSAVSDGQFSQTEILARTTLAHIKTLAVFFVAFFLGAEVFICLALSVLNGYALAYSVASLFCCYGIKTLFILVFAIAPPKLFVLAGYAHLFSGALSSKNKVSSPYRGFVRDEPFSRFLIPSFLLIFTGIVAECFYTPLILRLFAGFYA